MQLSTLSTLSVPDEGYSRNVSTNIHVLDDNISAIIADDSNSTSTIKYVSV
jgi:hypothetical protein